MYYGDLLKQESEGLKELVSNGENAAQAMYVSCILDVLFIIAEELHELNKAIRSR